METGAVTPDPPVSAPPWLACAARNAPYDTLCTNAAEKKCFTLSAASQRSPSVDGARACRVEAITIGKIMRRYVPLVRRCRASGIARPGDRAPSRAVQSDL